MTVRQAHRKGISRSAHVQNMGRRFAGVTDFREGTSLPDRAEAAGEATFHVASSGRNPLQGREAASRLAHNQEIPGASPGPATITLSEAVAGVLALVAAHDGRAPEDVIARAVCARAEEIGLSFLLDDELIGSPSFQRASVSRFAGGP